MPSPDYLGKDRQAKRPDYLGRDDGVNWRQHEKDTAKRSGGRQQPGSGNQPGKPGDIKGIRWLRENKASKSGAAGIFIRGTWLQKLVSQALPMGLDPALEIRLDGQLPPVPTDWIMIPSVEFEALLERAGEKVTNGG